MKKYLAVMVSCMMVMSLVACGGTEEVSSDSSVQVEAEAPDMSNTAWTFAGGYIDGVELTQEDYDAAFQAYGGSLQFVFDENGGAQMVQGGGTLDGSWSYTEENTVGVLFEREEGDLFYLCSFTELDGQVVMVAYSDETGENALYFVQ